MLRLVNLKIKEILIINYLDDEIHSGFSLEFIKFSS